MKSNHYIMKDQNRNCIDNIMDFDLTWRQKKSSKSLHMAIIGGLSVVWMLAQLL